VRMRADEKNRTETKLARDGGTQRKIYRREESSFVDSRRGRCVCPFGAIYRWRFVWLEPVLSPNF
jgi:hypothetical protein